MRSVLPSSLLATSLAASLLAGCTDDPGPETGAYQLVSTVDATAEAIQPRQIDEVVVTLRDFSANPAGTMIALADATRDPAMTVLRTSISATLLTRLPGWINEELLKVRIQGKTLPEFADQISMLARTSLTRFAVQSELVLDGGAPSHRITGLHLSPAGLPLAVPFDALAGEVLDQQPEAVVGADGALSLGDQRFSLAYGEHAWQAIDAASTSLFGDTVRAALGAGVDCPAAAKVIAQQCILEVCVGHEAEIRNLCEASLDLLVKTTRDKLATIKLDTLHLSQGAARVAGDQITDGTWQAEIDLGVGLGVHAAPATFSGGR